MRVTTPPNMLSVRTNLPNWDVDLMQAITTIARVFLFVGCTCALVGCSTTSPKEAFFRKHPDLRSRYVRFDEASPDVIRDFRQQSYRSELAVLNGFREHFSQDSDVTNYVAQVQARLDQFHDGDMKFGRQLEQDFNAKTDQLFFYDYREGRYQEQGWLILRRGQIFKKYQIASGYTTEP